MFSIHCSRFFTSCGILFKTISRKIKFDKTTHTIPKGSYIYDIFNSCLPKHDDTLVALWCTISMFASDNIAVLLPFVRWHFTYAEQRLLLNQITFEINFVFNSNNYIILRTELRTGVHTYVSIVDSFYQEEK